MSIVLEPIVRRMDNGVELIQQNFNTVKNELERMNGSVVEIPKEQFTPINGLGIDRNSAKGSIFKFDSFAIIFLQSYVSGVNMKAWNYKEAVSIPRSYLNGFSKFAQFGVGRRLTDSSWQYDVDFKVDKGVMTVYTRGNDYNNVGLDVTLAGILYN